MPTALMAREPPRLRNARRVNRQGLGWPDSPPDFIRACLAEAEKVGYKADWVQAYLREYKSPTDKKFTGKAPLPMSSRGTRAHKVEYQGAEISRRMACYWRKHSCFRDCKEFILSLFIKPIPKTPFADGLTMLDWEVNSAFQEHMRLVRMSKMLNEPRTMTTRRCRRLKNMARKTALEQARRWWLNRQRQLKAKDQKTRIFRGFHGYQSGGI